jgi:hypothetical protein
MHCKSALGIGNTYARKLDTPTQPLLPPWGAKFCVTTARPLQMRPTTHLCRCAGHPWRAQDVQVNILTQTNILIRNTLTTLTFIHCKQENESAVLRAHYHCSMSTHAHSRCNQCRDLLLKQENQRHPGFTVSCNRNICHLLLLVH